MLLKRAIINICEQLRAIEGFLLADPSVAYSDIEEIVEGF
jgi:hypothetical protein